MRPPSNDLTKSRPLHSDFLSLASGGGGGREAACCDGVNTLSTFAFVVSSVTTLRTGFCTVRETFTPRRLTPPGMQQHKLLSHCCVWNIILASIHLSIIILDLFCCSKIAHKASHKVRGQRDAPPTLCCCEQAPRPGALCSSPCLGPQKGNCRKQNGLRRSDQRSDEV